MTSSQSHERSQGSMRSAGSVAEELALPLYRLRSWESLYPVFRTEQGPAGERYYDAHAVEVVRTIARLLYQEGAKSHEILPMLRREGLVEVGEKVEGQAPLSSPLSENRGIEDDSAKKAEELSHQLENVQQENARLNAQLEEFGKIALSLKALEDENTSLKGKLEQARSASVEQDEGKAVYLDELETKVLALEELTEQQEKELEEKQRSLLAQEGEQEHLDALKVKITELETEQQRFASLQESLEAKRLEAVQRCDVLEAENKALQEAQGKRQGEDAAQGAALAARVEELEKERHGLVQKLEQSVLIMQSLEDENVRLKRSLKAGEAVEQERRAQAEQLAVLEAENAALKQNQAGLAEERERHARGLERIRDLEAEGTSLRQRLAVQDELNRASSARQTGVNQLLQGILGELAQMKKTLVD